MLHLRPHRSYRTMNEHDGISGQKVTVKEADGVFGGHCYRKGDLTPPSELQKRDRSIRQLGSTAFDLGRERRGRWWRHGDWA